MSPSIDFLKRQARRIAKANGSAHSQALDQLAQAHGFRNWSQFMKNRKSQKLKPMGMDLVERIRMHRSQTIDPDLVLAWVAARRGPVAPWYVDLAVQTASLGSMVIHFYETADGRFALNGMAGPEITTEQDCELVEDGIACIASAMAIQTSTEKGSSLQKRQSFVLDDAYHDFSDPVQAAGFAQESYELNRADSIRWAEQRCREDVETRNLVFRLRAELRQAVAGMPGNRLSLRLLADDEELNSYFVLLGHFVNADLERIALRQCETLKAELNLDLHPSFFNAQRSYSKRPPPTFIPLP